MPLLSYCEKVVCLCGPAGRCTYVGYPSVHHLLPDEYISSVATTCKVATASLELANSQIADYNNVTAGMPVCVPQKCCSSLKCTGRSDLVHAATGLLTADGMLTNKCPCKEHFMQLNHPSTLWLTCSVTQSLTHQPTHSLTCLPSCTSICSLTHSLSTSV